MAYEEWSHYSEGVISAALVDAAIPVVPVFLSELDATFWANVDSAGDDIRFTNADGSTALSYYLVNINVGSETGLVLLKADGMSASVDTTYRAYCGNMAASSESSSSAVFSGSNYVGFYFPGMTTINLANPGTGDLTAVNAPTTAASGFEGLTAAVYNGTDQYHYATSNLGLTSWPLSLHSMFSFSSHAANQNVMSMSNASSFNSYARLQAITNPRINALCQGASGSSSAAQVTTNLSDSTTYFAWLSRNANTGTTTAAVSGVGTGTNSTTLTTPSFDTVAIAALPRGGGVSEYGPLTVSFAAAMNSVASTNIFNTINNSWTNASFWNWGITLEQLSQTDWLRLRTASQTSGEGEDFSNLSNAADANDATFATAVLLDQPVFPNIRYSESVRFTNADLSGIPAGAYGIELHFRIRKSADGGGHSIYDQKVKPVWNSTELSISEPNAVQWAGVRNDDYVSGFGLTDEDFALDSTLGVSIRAMNDGGNDGNAKLYEAWMKVFWEGVEQGTGNFFPLM